MRKLLIPLITLLIGLGLGYQFGNFGHKIKDGVHQAYGADIDRKDIRAVLSDQAAAWNRGDISTFMEGYWQSEELQFASGGTIAKGWQTTKTRYETRYPDKATMGELAFTDLDVTLLSETDALVFGRWRLMRANDAPSGLFTLHFKNVNETWVIVSDHTSSGD